MESFEVFLFEKRGAVYFHFVPLRLDYLNHSSIDTEKLLLISNSASQGQPYLGYTTEEVGRFLGPVAQDVLFAPYVTIIYSQGEYVVKVNNALGGVGVNITGLRTYGKPLQTLASAQVIMVGGGDAWTLLKQLQNMGAMKLIREHVLEGSIPYVGWSTGSNLACPTIMTTNDMPICSPDTTQTLGLISFQTDPHYLGARPEGHGDETREQHIREFIRYNPNYDALGLREDSMFHIMGDKITLQGEHTARLFNYPTFYDSPLEIEPGVLPYSGRK